MVYSCLGRENPPVTVAATAIGLTDIPANANIVYALCRVLTASIRIGIGFDPVADGTTGGLIKYADEEFEIWGLDDIRRFRAIRTGATSASLEVLYFGTPA